MPKYRVRQGKKFGPGGRFPAGTILEMSEREAKPFLDILEPAPSSALVGSTQEVVSHEELGLKNELGAEVPDDLKIMPGVINLDEDTSAAEPSEDTEEEEEKPQAPKPQRRPGSRSTRRGSHEG